MKIARHVDTDEALPEDLYQKLCRAKTFRAASQMLRQARPTGLRATSFPPPFSLKPGCRCQSIMSGRSIVC